MLSQTKTLIWKNVQSKRHKWLRTILDISMPIIYMLILVWIFVTRTKEHGETNLHLHSGSVLSHQDLINELADSFQKVRENGFLMPTIGISPPGYMADMLESYLTRSTSNFEPDRRIDGCFFLRFPTEEGMINFIKDKSYLYSSESRRIFMSVVIEDDELYYREPDQTSDFVPKRYRIRAADLARVGLTGSSEENISENPSFGSKSKNTKASASKGKESRLISYKLRANLTQSGISHVPSTDNIADPPVDAQLKGTSMQYFQGFRDNGYHLFQSIIDEHALFMMGASPNDMRQLSAADYDQRITITAQPMPTLAYSDVNDMKLMLYLSIILIIDGYFYLFRTFVRGLVQEKVMQQQFEAINVGVRSIPIIASSCIVCFVELTIISLFTVPIVAIVFDKTEVLHIVLLYLAFNAAFMSFGVFFSLLFKESKMVTFCSFVLFFWTILITFLGQMGQVGSQHFSCFTPISGLSGYIQTVIIFQNSPIEYLSFNTAVSKEHLCNCTIFIYLCVGAGTYMILAVIAHRARTSYLGMQTIWMRIRNFICCIKSDAKVSKDGTVRYARFNDIDDTTTNNSVALPIDTKLTKIEQDYLAQSKIENIMGIPAVEVVNVSVQKKTRQGYQMVLRGINLSIPENHITAVVGGEKSGSSTLQSLISGITDPSIGSIRLMGDCIMRINTRDNNTVGYCSNEDIVLPELTVWQHMSLLASLKNLNKDDPEVIDHLNELLVQVGLGIGCEDDARHKLMNTLSGGQKRRVNVAMALIGKPKIIVLDNFTNGVDSSSRQLMLQLLRTLRTERVVIFTTNNYDDVTIADSIVVMEEGMVSSFGTPAYLRDKCGLGYTLTFVKAILERDESSASNSTRYSSKNKQWTEMYAQVQESIDQYPDVRGLIKYSHENRHELVYHVRSVESTAMPMILETVEEVKAQLGFTDVTLYVRTFDDVIFKKNVIEDSSTSQEDDSRDVLKELWDSAKKPTQIYDSATDQVVCLPRIDSGAKSCNAEGTSPLFEDVYSANILMRILYQLASYAKIHFFTLLRKPNTLRNVFLWPSILLLITVAMVMPNGSLVSRTMSPTIYSGYPVEFTLGAGKDEDNLSMMLHTFSDQEAVAVKTDNYYDRTLEGRQRSLLDTVHKYEQFRPRVGAITIQEYVKIPFSLRAIVHYNTSAADSSLVFTSLLSNMRYREFLASNNLPQNQGDMEVQNHPLPSTQMNFTVVSFLAVLTLVLFLAQMLFPSSAAKDVSRLLQQIIHVEKLSGMMLPVFWLSRYFVDVAVFQLNSIAATALLILSNLENYMKDYLCFYMSCLSFALAIFPMMYCLAFICKTDNSTHNTSLAITCLGTFMILLPFVILLSLDETQWAIVVMYFGMWSPTFVFACIFMTVNSNMPILHLPYNADEFLMILRFQAIFYFSMLLFLHWAAQNHLWERLKEAYFRKPVMCNLKTVVMNNPHEDIYKLHDDIAHGVYDDPMKYPLVVRDLSKTYDNGKTHVLKDVSFAVERGSILGLLGKNGCGKSTTIKAIIGGTSVNLNNVNGYVRINGRRIDQGTCCANDIGYCPQFSSLYEYLTPAEHVEHYAVLRGMTNPFRKIFLETLLFELDLSDVKNKRVHMLDVGMKRKLSLAIALIGNPSLIIIDELNVDLITRKRIHQVIRKCAAERAVIFTSHLLDEVEHICDRVMIMKNGFIRTIGTSNELKEKHGNAYLLTVKIAQGWEDMVVMTLRSFFYDLTIVEKSHNTMRFMIYKDQVSNLLDIFTRMEEVKQTLTCSATGKTVHVIEDFNVGDPNFQQIFNSIVEEQEDLTQQEDLNEEHKDEFH